MSFAHFYRNIIASSGINIRLSTCHPHVFIIKRKNDAWNGIFYIINAPKDLSIVWIENNKNVVNEKYISNCLTEDMKSDLSADSYKSLLNIN